MVTKRLKILNDCYLINKYILNEFSNQDVRRGVTTLDESVVDELAQLNQIVGRMQLYYDKSDYENFDLTHEWFIKFMDDNGYNIDDFNNFLEDERNSD
jgi:hypothetical protein